MIGTIVDRVTVGDVLRLGGFEQPNRHGFVSCPLHSENSASFHIVGDGRGWRCFGCGRKGGVLDLVVALGIAVERAGAAQWLEWVAR
jgi:DNA primase